MTIKEGNRFFFVFTYRWRIHEPEHGSMVPNSMVYKCIRRYPQCQRYKLLNRMLLCPRFSTEGWLPLLLGQCQSSNLRWSKEQQERKRERERIFEWNMSLKIIIKWQLLPGRNVYGHLPGLRDTTKYILALLGPFQSHKWDWWCYLCPHTGQVRPEFGLLALRMRQMGI